MAKKGATGVGGARGDPLEHVAAYHKELQLCLREHESKFDNAVLLAAGGAFTISAAFISDLGSPLSAGTWLAMSWGAWGLCLLAGVGGHLVGAHATKRVLDLLDSQNYDPQVLMSGKVAKLIQPLNIATFVLLLVGFIAFGRFTFANLDFGGAASDQEKKQEVGQAEGRRGEEGLPPTDKGAQRAVAGSEVAAPQTNDSQVRADNGRQEDAATTTATPTAAARPPQEGPDTVHARKADGAHGAKPAAGVAPAAKEVSATTGDTAR
jgi:hypothetical protein